MVATGRLVGASALDRDITERKRAEQEAAARNRQQAAVAALRLLTRGALAEMRTLLAELRPAALTDAELGGLLRQVAVALAVRHHLVT